MKRIKIIAALMFYIGSLTLMRCSLISGPLAGGSGLGNPPTNVTFAMIADTGLPALGKKAASDLSIVNNLSGRKLGIKDRNGLAFSVNSAMVTVQAIRFVVAAPESLTFFILDKGTGFDNTGIVVTGPFVFDVLNNTIDPPVDSLKLPRTKYLGVEMVVKNKDGVPAIEIAGEFAYDNSVHGFLFSLLCDKTGRYAKQDGFLLEDTLKTSITVRLNASTWLDSVDLGSCLDKGWISFDSNGVLVVDDKMPQGCNKYNRVIQDNIINSGRVETKK